MGFRLLEDIRWYYIIKPKVTITAEARMCMEPKKLRLLLIVGVAAMIVSVICFIGVSSLMQSINERNARTNTGDAVIGDLTWDEILAAGSDKNKPEESQQSEASASGSAQASAEASGSASAQASGSASARPSPTASASASQTPSSTPTLAPSARPTILIGGGLVPYDNRKFEVSSGGIPQAGYAKVITIVREKGGMRGQDITWEMDVPYAGDVHVTMKGTPIGDKDTVGTGALVQLYEDDRIVDTAVVVLPGDVLGTGEIDAAQLAALKAAAADPARLEGAYFLAADLDGSGAIDDKDVAILAERLGEDAEEAPQETQTSEEEQPGEEEAAGEEEPEEEE